MVINFPTFSTEEAPVVQESKPSVPQAVIDFLDQDHSNSFLISIKGQLDKKGTLSEKQIACVQRMLKPKPKSLKLDLTQVNEAILKAYASGLKKPALSLGKYRVSIAPAAGKNAGCLYLKIEGEYAGKINKEGEMFFIYSSKDQASEIHTELSEIFSDLKAKIIELGRETGVCCCCARLLTKKQSIEDGIGPICKSKWGL